MDKEKTAAGALAANNTSKIYHKINREKFIIGYPLIRKSTRRQEGAV